MNNLFEIYGIHIIDTEETADTIILRAVPDDKLIYCPACKKRHVSKDGKYVREITDIPIKEKRTILRLESNRFNCLNPLCTKNTFTPYIPLAFDERARITLRLKNAIANSPIYDRTFDSIAHQYHVSPQTVKTIFRNKIKEIDTSLKYRSVKIIGLDECHIQHDMRLVITDLSGNAAKLIDIGPNRKKSTVVKYLLRFDNPDVIEFVMMDMSRAYKEAVEEVFANAKPVIDHFHVIVYLEKAIEASRKQMIEYFDVKVNALPKEQQDSIKPLWEKKKKTMSHYWFKTNIKKLSSRSKRELADLIKNFPEFGEILRLKQLFNNIYAANSRQGAEAAFEVFKNQKSINNPNSPVYPFHELVLMVNRWKNYIFNYFDVPPGYMKTNAGTEGLNSEIKRINNLGRGYAFDVLRGKLLFAKEKIVIQPKSSPESIQLPSEYWQKAFYNIEKKQYLKEPTDLQELKKIVKSIEE